MLRIRHEDIQEAFSILGNNKNERAKAIRKEIMVELSRDPESQDFFIFVKRQMTEAAQELTGKNGLSPEFVEELRKMRDLILLVAGPIYFRLDGRLPCVRGMEARRRFEEYSRDVTEGDILEVMGHFNSGWADIFRGFVQSMDAYAERYRNAYRIVLVASLTILEEAAKLQDGDEPVSPFFEEAMAAAVAFAHPRIAKRWHADYTDNLMTPIPSNVRYGPWGRNETMAN